MLAGQVPRCLASAEEALTAAHGRTLEPHHLHLYRAAMAQVRVNNLPSPSVATVQKLLGGGQAGAFVLGVLGQPDDDLQGLWAMRHCHRLDFRRHLVLAARWSASAGSLPTFFCH